MKKTAGAPASEARVAESATVRTRLREAAYSCLLPWQRMRLPARYRRTLGRPVPGDVLRDRMDTLLGFEPWKPTPAESSSWRLGSVLGLPARALFHVDGAFYIRKGHPDVWETQLQAREDGGLSGGYQFDRLLEIEALVRLFKPESVLELGSGTSSCLFAKLLGDRNRFMTLEESPHWHERFQRYAAPYLDRMTSCCVPKQVGRQAGEAVCWYDIDHGRYFDLVYVDGPYTKAEGEDVEFTYRRCGHMADYDVGKFWENGVYPRVIVFDNRKPSVRRLILDSKDRYDVYLNSTARESLMGRPALVPQYHHIFIRKNGVAPCEKS